MNIEIMLGKTREHLVQVEETKFFVHQQMLVDFLRLQNAAKKDDIDLQIVSAFRDYDRQAKIWNAKASGERAVLDDHENPIDISKLSPTQLAFAILRWSAIPGCSRHHWGTDVDVFDASTQKIDEVKLIPSECEKGGLASRLHEWLDDRMSSNNAYGFFRPFKTDLGGVAPERWHISYYPIARRIIDSYTFSIFKKNLEDSEIKLKEVLLENADEIYHRYLLNFDLP